MNAKTTCFLLFFCLVQYTNVMAQNDWVPSRKDTLRGSITEERSWWDAKRYDIRVTPNIVEKTLNGTVKIRFEVAKQTISPLMQIDLQTPMQIDSALFKGQKLEVSKIDIHAWHIAFKGITFNAPKRKTLQNNEIIIFFSGKPREAVRPPWDGGWIWRKDDKGRPWISVACQGLGASVWFPCKDHQSDEPDLGASLTVMIPDTLQVVSNGRKIAENQFKGKKSVTWEVQNPINLYNIVPYIGKYASFSDTLKGEKGNLTLNYWVLDYNINKAKKQFEQVKPMLRAFEYWMGPYPFYEDGYQLVESPHLGMEHQSAVAYGNKYQNGYLGRDLSATGWGLKWDFIIIHESGHEWFGNNITSNEVADMWIHESFTNYTEALFTEYYYGKEAATDYVKGIRRNIANDIPIIGQYGVHKEGSGSDMYYKGSNMLHTMRNSIGEDALFRKMLRNMNQRFYHKTITTQQMEKFISESLRFDFSKVFDQYLRTTQIPTLSIQKDTLSNTVVVQWKNCVEGFNLPITLSSSAGTLRLFPTTEKATYPLKKWEVDLLLKENLLRYFYIKVE